MSVLEQIGGVAGKNIFDAGPTGATLSGDGTTDGPTVSTFGKSSPTGWQVDSGKPAKPVLAVIPITSYDQTNTNETYSFFIQESPDGVNWTTVSRTAVVGGTAPTDVIATTGGTLLIGFMHSMLYVRLVKTLAGTSPTITYGPCWLWTDGCGLADQYQ
jgi:hypothetical protein